MLECIYAELKETHGIGYIEKDEKTYQNKFYLPWDHLRIKDERDKDYGKLIYPNTQLDMKFFKNVTMGKNIIMGRKTFESMKETTLKGRKNHFIITHKPDSYNSDCTPNNVIYITLDDMIKLLCIDSKNEYVCIGGGSILKKLIPFASYVHINTLSFNKKLLEMDGFREPKANIIFDFDNFKHYFCRGSLLNYNSIFYSGTFESKTYYNKLSNTFIKNHFPEIR